MLRDQRKNIKYMNLVSAKNFLCEIGRIFESINSKKLALIYLIMAVPQAIFLLIATPPMQSPDAINHFMRAYQVYSLGNVGSYKGGAGGLVDTGIISFSAPLAAKLAFHYENKISKTDLDKSQAVQLTGKKVESAFPNTVQYPFYGYLPQVASFILLGRSGNQVYKIYFLACALNILSALFLTYLSIRKSVRTSMAIFTMGLLPMTLSLYASVSQDALLISTCFLFIAIADSMMSEPGGSSNKSIRLFAILAVLIGIARPPYIILAFTIFSPLIRVGEQHSLYKLKVRLKIFFCIVLPALIAGLLMFLRARGGIAVADVSAAGQLAELVRHPLFIFNVARDTLATNGISYIQSTLAVLGWFDTRYPNVYYVASASVAIFSLAVSTHWSVGTHRSRSFDSAALLSVVFAMLGVFFALYLTWTKVGASVIDGVQGRYFIALLPMFAASIPGIFSSGLGKSNWSSIGGGALMTVILVFPVFSFGMTVYEIIGRYYLSA